MHLSDIRGWASDIYVVLIITLQLATNRTKNKENYIALMVNLATLRKHA